MAVRLVTTIQRWEGLSTDNKPTSGVSEGSTFKELDGTGKKFVYHNSDWQQDTTEPVSTVDYSITEATGRRLVEDQILKSEFNNDGHYSFIENR